MGANPWTEHYSAVQADVPDPQDPATQLNRALVERNANCVHNGLLTFLFDDSKISQVRYQITHETCEYFQFDMWGQVGATYTITVSNVGGGATVGMVTVVDSLPAGLTAMVHPGPTYLPAKVHANRQPLES